MNVALRGTHDARVAPARPAGGALARVEIIRDMAKAEPRWRELQDAGAVASPYQHHGWVCHWYRQVSVLDDEAPYIVVGLDAVGNALFLWPLVRRRFGPFNILTFFGGKHATINMALWRRDVAAALTAADMRRILADVAREAPDLDFVMLFNQPAVWHGAPNPFMRLPHQRSNEDNFVLRLGQAGTQILEREISAAMRGRLRNKERKLSKLDGYRYLRADTPDEVDRCLNSFFAQKTAKLTALGIDDVFAQPGVAEFIRAACHDGLAGGQPVIELHALEGGGEMLALFSGIHDGRRFTSMFNSHTGSDHARYSPGLILLQHLIAHCADRGFASFDIGPGEARYKTFFCKEVELIFDSVLPLSSRGHALAVPLRLYFRARSMAKRSTLLSRALRSVRSLLRGGDRSAAPAQD